jgi:fluoride exporter
MEALAKSLWVGVGGFVGANLRFWIGEIMGQRGAMVFPWGTLIINVAGSLAIGVFCAWELKYLPHFAYRLLFAVGICGGFTTFSTFSWEAIRLAEKSQWLSAAVYVAASVVLSIGACAAGFFIAKPMFGG